MKEREILTARMNDLYPDLSSEQIGQFCDYYEFLIEKNKVMNLTAITEVEDVLQKHFMDSLMISGYYDMEKVSSVIDIGTGAGFPGIPLKIAYPHLKICLVDSLGKRVQFLKDAAGRLGLTDVEAIHARAEDLGHQKEYREAFDLCTSRAVSRLSTLSEYCIPFVRKGGYFIAYKSGNVQEEAEEALHSVKILGGEIREIPEFVIPGTTISRSLVMIEKKSPTSRIYPRKAGTPQKQPL